MPQLAIRGSLGTRVFRSVNERKDGLTVKKFVALLVAVALFAVFAMGPVGCGKKDSSPAKAADATPSKAS